MPCGSIVWRSPWWTIHPRRRPQSSRYLGKWLLSVIAMLIAPHFHTNAVGAASVSRVGAHHSSHDLTNVVLATKLGIKSTPSKKSSTAARTPGTNTAAFTC